MPRLSVELFKSDKPDQVLATKIVDKQALLVGRAPDCDWVLEDPERRLSRHHCEIEAGENGVFLTDLSANGILLQNSGQRLERGKTAQISLDDSFAIGDFVMRLLIAEGEAEEVADVAVEPAPVDEATSGVGDESETVQATAGTVTEVSTAGTEGDALLSAFLRGAGLEQGDLDIESPDETLEAVGNLFRMFVVNLCDLLNDRSIVKAQFRAEQTLVVRGNSNPFKVFKPEEVLSRLITGADGPFQKGPEAVEATFKDVKRHQMAVLAGMNGALNNLIARLSPHEIEQTLQSRSTMSVISSGGKKSAAWDAYQTLFERLEDDVADMDSSRFMSDFRAGYESRLRQLENMDR